MLFIGYNYYVIFFVASDSAILDYAIMDNVGPVQPLIKRTVVTDRIRDAWEE